MKYDITLIPQPLPALEIQIEDDDPASAIRQAQANNPGYSATMAVERIETGNGYGEVFELAGTCEWCEKMVFGHDELTHVHDEQGDAYPTCKDCMETFRMHSELEAKQEQARPHSHHSPHSTTPR